MRIKGIIATRQLERLRNGWTQDAKRVEHRANRPQVQHKTQKNSTTQSSAKVR